MPKRNASPPPVWPAWLSPVLPNPLAIATAEPARKTAKPFVMDGIEYASIAAGARAHGLSSSDLRRWRRQGLSVEEALREALAARPVHDGVVHRNRRALRIALRKSAWHTPG